MDSATIETASEPFLGEWKRLVSTTNWDKGRIIHEWRTALVAAHVSASDYADEAWSRQVGGVTPQHVGRLRRVFERFGEVRDGYAGLYWSHFQAALDWNDAEMWLEGAVQNDWSISEMRRTRWEALGVPAELKPRDEDVVSSDWDEDAEPAAVDEEETNALAGKIDTVRPAHRANDAEDAPWSDGDADDESEGAASESGWDGGIDDEPLRPFANLATLPADVSEAFESFKLCILKHRLAGWAELPREDLLASLDALKELALAPACV